MTPLRRQYVSLKQRYPDAILFFRLGDFYETFDADARVAAAELQITLTSRALGKGDRVPMAGVPAHAAEGYIARLIAAGHKVALCEQFAPPADGKPRASRMMRREVVRVVTPGTVLEPGLLAATRNNYLCAIAAGDPTLPPRSFGLAYADVTTGEFVACELGGREPGAALAALAQELERLRPAECLVPDDLSGPWADWLGEERGRAYQALTTSARWRFDHAAAEERLCRHFGVAALDGFGCANTPLAVRAAGALLGYVEETNPPLLRLLTDLHTESPSEFVQLDASTRRNLELFEGRGNGLLGERTSLLSVVDRTRTPGGGRLLRRWLGQPLLDLTELGRRLDAVESFVHCAPLRDRLAPLLARVTDVERLRARIEQGTAAPRDLHALHDSLEAAAAIKDVLQSPGSTWPPLVDVAERLDACPEVTQLIARGIAADAGSERRIRPGFNGELDDLIRRAGEARQWIADLETSERERTGIRGLKVGYNQVFGYYLQVSNSYRGRVPEQYIRRQTLTDSERYITPELKEFESLVLHAEDRMQELERTLYESILNEIAARGLRLARSAAALAEVDLFLGLAQLAVSRRYTRPSLDESDQLRIVDGRHPVVEAALEAEPAGSGAHGFIANDCALDTRESQVIILTGPNMAGKSTYLRQVALITLLAQVGSFVPAVSAQIGLVDRIFTRVGAQDELARGRSTFMVEMLETAAILHSATRRSLVVLDEIGRGTSTHDGVAIAQAVIEYLHNHPRLGCRTLFATHFHELAKLELVLPRVRNYCMDVLEEGDQVVFLHTVVPGSAGRSFGIHVAQLAGVPRAVTRRAAALVGRLEGSAERDTPIGPNGQTSAPPAGASDRAAASRGRRPPGESAALQLSLFAQPHPALEALQALDVNSLTPLEALTKLVELQQQARES